jgi:hypothetical protein
MDLVIDRRTEVEATAGDGHVECVVELHAFDDDLLLEGFAVFGPSSRFGLPIVN